MSTDLPGFITYEAEKKDLKVADLPRQLAVLRHAAGHAFEISPGFVYFDDVLSKKRVQVRWRRWRSYGGTAYAFFSGPVGCAPSLAPAAVVRRRCHRFWLHYLLL